MSIQSAYRDDFAARNLPPLELWPERDFSQIPELDYPARLNCAVELLEKTIEQHSADNVLFYSRDRNWTYGEFLETVNRYAHVLRDDFKLQSGNRVLLRGPNTPQMAALWFAVLRAGGICVTTMPLLREKELSFIIDKAEVSLCVCDARWAEDLEKCKGKTKTPYETLHFMSGDSKSLESRSKEKPAAFDALLTAASDIALIAFTSGTTGSPKATMHEHRDVMAICDCFPRYVLKPESSDIFCGTPPFAFTFGLGALLLFPMRFGASAALVEKPGLTELLDVASNQKATILFTSPTAYRAMLDQLSNYDLSSLKKCVSAGETLPLPTFEAWQAATGIKIIDGIGATELLHIFISASDDDIRPGATGRPVPGYQAIIVDKQGRELPAGEVGLLAVRGPTGCRYLADERQKKYVQNGWNLTGDAYLMDQDGYFWFQARADDMIISSGYNISGIEVEAVLLSHDKVKECAVVGAPDVERGQIVKAFVILKDPEQAHEATVKELQDYVKAEIAPYKYPRAIAFVNDLPRTETGKLQRFKLREAC